MRNQQQLIIYSIAAVLWLHPVTGHAFWNSFFNEGSMDQFRDMFGDFSFSTNTNSRASGSGRGYGYGYYSPYYGYGPYAYPYRGYGVPLQPPGYMPGQPLQTPPAAGAAIPGAGAAMPEKQSGSGAMATSTGIAQTGMKTPTLPASGEITVSPVSGGMVLANSQGLTLYTFTQDGVNQSNCNGQCASNWPPAIAGKYVAVVDNFSLVRRSDGSQQWAYNGKPLYTWVGDRRPGDITGDGVGGTWNAARL